MFEYTIATDTSTHPTLIEELEKDIVVIEDDMSLAASMQGRPTATATDAEEDRKQESSPLPVQAQATVCRVTLVVEYSHRVRERAANVKKALVALKMASPILVKSMAGWYIFLEALCLGIQVPGLYVAGTHLPGIQSK